MSTSSNRFAWVGLFECKYRMEIFSSLKLREKGNIMYCRIHKQLCYFVYSCVSTGKVKWLLLNLNSDLFTVFKLIWLRVTNANIGDIKRVCFKFIFWSWVCLYPILVSLYDAYIYSEIFILDGRCAISRLGAEQRQSEVSQCPFLGGQQTVDHVPDNTNYLTEVQWSPIRCNISYWWTTHLSVGRNRSATSTLLRGYVVAATGRTASSNKVGQSDTLFI